MSEDHVIGACGRIFKLGEICEEPKLDDFFCLGCCMNDDQNEDADEEPDCQGDCEHCLIQDSCEASGE